MAAQVYPCSWRLIAICTVIFFALSCTTYFSKDLKKGVSGQFATSPSDVEKRDKYDWSKLKGDYGLFVLFLPNDCVAGSPDKYGSIGHNEGLRIFEHHFKSKDSDTIVKIMDFKVLGSSTQKFGYRETRTLHLRIPCQFVKRQLTYGGVVEIDAKEMLPQYVEVGPIASLPSS